MSDEPFDAAKIAAECKAKVGRRKRKGELPDPPVVEDIIGAELGEKPIHPLSKFRPEMVEQAKKLCAAGFTVPELADFFDVTKRTFNHWRVEHPELEEAVRLGREPANERTKLSMYALANGYDYEEEVVTKIRTDKFAEGVIVTKVRKHKPPDYQAAAFFLTNKLPEEFRHRKTTDHTGEVQHRVTPATARKELEEFLRGEAAPTPAKAAPASVVKH